ncbi:MAG: glycoside hydrolase family 15 protein [Methanotrichaceae archaeon]|nr:glycoside hydrolase family 15 protein [Methanotrichaceae archaeon]
MRPLIFGNGRILICEDDRGIIRDIYYPHVGLEDHCNLIRAGIYDQNNHIFSWLDDWNIQQRYKSDFKDDFFKNLNRTAVPGEDETGQATTHFHPSNIGESIFDNPWLGLQVLVWDAIHPSSNYFCRVFEVKNRSEYPRDLRLFSNQNYNILENKISETAVIDRDVLIHYKRDRYILHGSVPQFDQYAVGIAGWRGLQGTWKDMEEDGLLSGNIVAHGSIDSTLSWTVPRLLPGQFQRIHMWMVIGKSYRQVINSHKRKKEEKMSNAYQLSFNFWKSFIERITTLQQCKNLSLLPEKIRQIFFRSLMTTVAHMDLKGSVIASCDSEIKQFGADLYTYCWPRDAAWAAIALDRARYHHLSKEIFDFLSKTITERGYFLHKYTPAGDFGSTWHPVPMIQIDETGLPLYALYHNWQVSKDVWTLGRYFSSLVNPAADYLASNIDKSTGLPAASFDLWEERKGTHTYSASIVYAGLHSASEIAKVLGHDEKYERWGQAAAIVKSAIPELFDDGLGRFKRSLTDSALDASAFAVWYFSILPADDPRIISTMQAIEKELMRPSGGIARYMHDSYQGYMNSWIICTLWLAQWHIALRKANLALKLIQWCADHTYSTGLMPEQIADDGTFRSVLPLMWSHCAYVLAVLEYLEALGPDA